MLELHRKLQNPLTRDRDARDRTRLVARFPTLRSSSGSHFLSMRRYLDSCPERFFDETSYEIFLNWLQNRDATDNEALKTYFSRFHVDVNRAMVFLREINSQEWHDKPLTTGDEFDLVRIIDRYVHPTYLRLIEAVLTPLVRPVAYFSRIDRSRGTEGLNVWSVIEELKGQPEEHLTLPYHNTIRNGIAHGGILFLRNGILYRDNKGNEETFHTASIVRRLDDLLDTCNGLAAALKVFILVSLDRGYIPPRELLIEELQEETRSPWWTIDGCVESEIPGKSQLIIYARPDSRDYRKIIWSSIQSGILTEFFAPDYDRYLFSLRSRKAWPGWVAFDGGKLRSLREAGINDLSQYEGIVEDNLIFYVPQPTLPAFFGTLETLAIVLRTHMPIAIQQLKEQLEIPRIVSRNATVHRNSWGGVLNADVVIEGLDERTAVEVIRKHRVRIVKTAQRHARRENRLSVAAHLPLGFAHVSVFRRDHRCRRLTGFGTGDDLVCTVRFQRIRRINRPDMIGSTVETIGKWRIAWNRTWLESTGLQLD